jgi:hypothetical protein
VVTLDGSTGVLSPSASLPATVANAGDLDVHLWSGNFFVTDGRDGRPRIIIVVKGGMKVLLKLHGEWAMAKEVVMYKVTHMVCPVTSHGSSTVGPVNCVTKGGSSSCP